MKMVPTWSFDWHVFQSYQYYWKNWVKFIFANTFTFLIGYMISVCIINFINKSIIPYLVIWNRFSMSTVSSKLDSSPHVDSSLNISWTWSRKLKAQSSIKPKINQTVGVGLLESEFDWHSCILTEDTSVIVSTDRLLKKSTAINFHINLSVQFLWVPFFKGGQH